MVLSLRIFNFLFQSPQTSVQVQQVRHKYADWKMIRDIKKRKLFQEYGKDILRIKCLRKNNILPNELKLIADEEVRALPKQSNPVKLVHRCAITSRSRGNLQMFRVSRIVFRNLADYNKISGMQRALW